MKLVGILFFLAALFYLSWYFISGQVGSEIGFVNLLVSGAIFFLLGRTDRPARPWFSAKRFGYGWGLPTSWHGYIVYLVFVLASALTVAVIVNSTHSVSDALIGIIPTVGLLVAALVAICYKYGEEPRWRWGEKK
jgi:hypothetical protein